VRGVLVFFGDQGGGEGAVRVDVVESGDEGGEVEGGGAVPVEVAVGGSGEAVGRVEISLGGKRGR